MTIILEGTAMTDRSVAHSHLAEQLDFPGWYGRNLDALYDLLTEGGMDTEIVLQDSAAVLENLGQYGESLLSTMQEAAQENPHLTVTLK